MVAHCPVAKEFDVSCKLARKGQRPGEVVRQGEEVERVLSSKEEFGMDGPSGCGPWALDLFRHLERLLARSPVDRPSYLSEPCLPSDAFVLSVPGPLKNTVVP